MTEIKVQKRIMIDLPAEDIFAYISQLENLLDWSGITVTVRKTSSGEVRAGTTMLSTMRFLGRWFTVAFEIVEYSPGRCLTFKSIAGSPSCLFCYQLEGQGDGGTATLGEAVVHVTDGLIDQPYPVIESAVSRQFEYDLQTLKDILEAGRIFA